MAATPANNAAAENAPAARPGGYSPVDYCVCPKCRGDLAGAGDQLRCAGCGEAFAVRAGIPVLLAATGDATRREYLECYEKLAQTDLDKPIVARKEPIHDTLLKFVGNVRGQRVLDIGSSQALYLRRMDASFKVAMDIAWPYLKSIERDARVACVCADAEQLPFKPGFFDVIVISDILEHVLDPEAVVRGLERIATDRTRIIVHIPWEESLESYTRYAQEGFKYTHLRRFTSYDIFMLFRSFRVRKRAFAQPALEHPLFMVLEPHLPVSLFNWLFNRYLIPRPAGRSEYDRRRRWIDELPRREWRLLRVYRPMFRILEFVRVGPPQSFRTRLTRSFLARPVRRAWRYLRDRRARPGKGQ